jgi:hypothetical protein
MWIYWAIFLWPALFAVLEPRLSPSLSKLAMLLFAIALTLIIGLRFEVGVDWPTYLELLAYAEGANWYDTGQSKDLAYGVLNWVAVANDSGIWLVNLVCAIVFVSGFFGFCRKLPNPWLALAVGIPYIVIVMGMSYTRQSAAFGFELLALVALQDARIRRFVILIIMASMFHKSALILLPIGALIRARNRFWVAFWIGAALVLSFIAFVAESYEGLMQGYVEAEMASGGAVIRVAMNAVAAAIFLAMRKSLGLQPLQLKIWTWISIIALLFIPAFVLSPSSTAVDRLALYFMPIQLLVFSHLPSAVRQWNLRRVAILFLVIGYALTMFVWFKYSQYNYAWLPYKFYPLEVL